MTKNAVKKGALYLVATPIGNLQDISFRAIEILKMVDWVAAEDTRHTKKLLSHYAINTRCFSLHEHNEKNKIAWLVEELQQGKNIALVSDAGTPLIQDPGFEIVRALHEENLSVIPIPGACAAICALIVSGLPTHPFVFYGFPPQKGSVREKFIATIAKENKTVILYESVHRVIDLFKLLLEYCGPTRMACIARELTKTFETIRQDSVENLLLELEENIQQQKGEFVIVIEGAKIPAFDSIGQTKILSLLLEKLSLKDAVDITAKITEGNKKEIYSQALKLKDS